MSKIYISEISVDVSNFQTAYNDLGLGTISPGKTIPSVITSIETMLLLKLTESWPVSFNPITPYQSDSAILTLMRHSGTIPLCVIDAIAANFKTWKIEVQKNIIQKIAKEVALKILTHTKTTSIIYGECAINENESIQWGVAFSKAVIVYDPEQWGIIYGFTAERASVVKEKKHTSSLSCNIV